MAKSDVAEIHAASRSDLMNELDKLLGQLCAQLSMMARADGDVFDEGMREEDRNWYVHAMSDQIYRLKDLSAKLWEAN